MPPPKEARALENADLTAIGYSQEEATRILALLSEEELLDYYLEKGRKAECFPLAKVSARYPRVLIDRLGNNAPGCLWAKGDASLLSMPMIALVGSRELRPENAAFAQMAGREAARQGYALVSGNARGADQTAQRAALEAGGCVISVVADSLTKHPVQKNILYLSLEGYEASFSPVRALQRNGIIHALGEKVLVAQCTLEKGGTWSGTRENLGKGVSPVFCFSDGSDAATRLAELGADLVTREQLHALSQLQSSRVSFL